MLVYLLSHVMVRGKLDILGGGRGMGVEKWEERVYLDVMTCCWPLKGWRGEGVLLVSVTDCNGLLGEVWELASVVSYLG